MTHTYTISGMTCGSCRDKVQKLLSETPGITKVEVDLHKGEANIQMSGHVQTSALKKSLSAYPKYQLTEADANMHGDDFTDMHKKTWWQIYKPIILIFIFITGISFIPELKSGRLEWMRWMNHFMGGFFLVFSFFKLLDLKGFAENYSTYDIIARKWVPWGYIYAFVELCLAIAYLLVFEPVITNMLTFIVMTISIIGVLQSIFNRRKIRCACLGAVFNLPMSTVTVIEDALMIMMSATMLFTLV